MSTSFNPADFDDVIKGTNGNDIIDETGSNLDLLIRARGGNDAISGGDGDDGILGGGGNDVFFAGEGDDHFDGQGGFDTYDAAELSSSVIGRFEFLFGGVISKGTNLGTDVLGRFEVDGAGNIITVVPVERVIAPAGKSDNLISLESQGPGDIPNARANVDLAAGTIRVIEQGTGLNFTVSALNFDDITGTNLRDRLFGDNQGNEIFGGAGNDVIRGRGGDDTLNGQQGNDRIFGNNGDDFISGGGGSDTLDGGNGDDDVFGNNGNDTFIGSSGDDRFVGGNGNDTADYSDLDAPIVFAQAGRIFKDGGALGIDQLGLDDPIEFVEKIIGDAGEINTIDTSGGSNLSASIDLRDHFVTVTVEVAITGIPGVADLPKGASITTTAKNFTNAIGTDDFADEIRGNSDDNVLIGGGGEDKLFGRSGHDILVGGEDADTINTGGGSDTVVLTDPDAIDTVTGFNAGFGSGDDDILISIIGISSAGTQVNGADLDIIVDDGGALNGTVLATLVDRSGEDGNIDIDIGAFSFDALVA